VSIRVLLADDQTLVRTGFRLILESEPDITVVAQAADGQQAVDAVRAHGPDLVLMDIQMPVLDGLEATRRILDQPYPKTRVLMLTTFERDDYIFQALRVGASGFLLKTAPAEELITAVRVVVQGGALLSPSVTRRVIAEFANHPSPTTTPPPGLDTLTARELEVLKLVARGLSNAEIATQLVVSETTVKTHVGRVLMKLRLRDRVQAVVLAYEHGLIHPGPDTVRCLLPKKAAHPQTDPGNNRND
jgi:DNA-binding NarL/FixJ family response regulator